MTNYSVGHDAETVAAKYLRKHGFKIRELNWKTRWCEIDVVAEKDKTIYFVEVKYRQSTRFGTGLDYITPKKVQQMSFAAEMWVSNHDWSGDYQLAALEVDGSTGEINFLEDL